MNDPISTVYPEALLTLPAVSKILNIPVHSLRRAAKRGVFPTYAAFSGRIRVRLSEVLVAVQAAQLGQDNA